MQRRSAQAAARRRIANRSAVVVAVMAAALVGVSPASAEARYRSATYPTSLQFSGISVAAEGLGLCGTANEDGNQGVDCLEAAVDARTLALSDVFEPRCDDPAMTGRSVVPVEASVDHGNYLSVRVARVSPDTGRTGLGPVLGVDEDASDTRPLWVYGPGSLWVYLTAPKGSPGASEVLRVSTSTGRVVQQARVLPALYRPVLVADVNGLYLSPAANGGAQTAPGTRDAVIFHVGLGAAQSNVFYRWPKGKWSGFANWMTASGDQVSADLCSRPVSPVKCELAQFDGPSGHPALVAPLPDLDGWAVDNPVDGLFSSLVPAEEANSPVPTTVVRIDPATGAVHRLASVVLPAYWGILGLDGNPGAAVYDGALYLLSPSATTLSGAAAPATLYRVPVGTGL